MCPGPKGGVGLRRTPGALPSIKVMRFWAWAMKVAVKGLLAVFLVLLLTRGAVAKSAPQAPGPQVPNVSRQSASATPTTPPPQASAQSRPGTPTESSPQAPTPTAPATFTQNALTATEAPALADPPPGVLPAATSPAPEPLISAQGPLHAAIIPALEARVGFSTLSRVSSPNNRVLYKGLNTSVTKQYTDRIGGTVEVGYLRAANVFHTGQSNAVLTYLLGPVFYPYQADGFATSLHALGGGARVSGAIALSSTPGQYLKGTVDDTAWALGGGVERWFFSGSLAMRVDVDALHTTFFNNAAKVHGEYDLRVTWGITYNLGPKKRGGKFRNMAGVPIE